MDTFGLIGKNIDYSFSKAYFNTFFKEKNLNCCYKNFDLKNLNLLQEILTSNPRIKGLNVTIPYKEKIIPVLDSLSLQASQIKAVNVIEFTKDGKLIGHNTDYLGFIEAIKPHIKSTDKQAIILGSGGASKAIEYGLKLLKIPYLVVSRFPKNLQIGYKQLDKDLIKHSNILINTTPIGTYPQIEEIPNFPIELLTSKHLVFDLIYNPKETQLIKKANQKGAKTLNGYRMLVEQAKAAWKIWNYT